MTIGRVVFGVMACATPCIAFAEVSDKVPSLLMLWTQAGAIGLLTAVVLYLWPRRAASWGVAVLAVGLAYVMAQPAPDLEVDIVRELGSSYLAHAQLSPFIVPVLALSGWLAHLVRPKHDASTGI